jgi:hypothetical protein
MEFYKFYQVEDVPKRISQYYKVLSIDSMDKYHKSLESIGID